uniref:Uncharacterized protein n=1 Tax=Siphoviridae sp. ctLfk13 TaxID=2826251 RepID=A0A8S5N1S4_9CAUD|nr:MAG TPA: hypothetical protein [Siphoviridae sp. ctLfk13]
MAKVIENPLARKGELASGFSHPIAHSNHTGWLLSWSSLAH